LDAAKRHIGKLTTEVELLRENQNAGGMEAASIVAAFLGSRG
jgi:hypothetical protein